ncbi:MAG TPA: MFS transporter [Stellaceae bacterium]|jgi:MFS family permease|nr:MFS transporter [Stellaceae bacterium]
MTTTTIAPREGIFANRWWIVVASLIGMIVGPGTAVIFVTNVFMVPVTTELGWTRGDFSSGLLASAVASPILTPLFGRLMDRFGIHKVALPASILYGLALASFSLLSKGSLWQIYLMFGCASGFGAAVGPVVYSKAITAWFDKERGLALGIATCGVGLGTFAIPAMAQFFVSAFGWRAGYIGVGITTCILSFGMISIFVREPPGYLERMRATQDAEAATGRHPFGLTARQAILGTHQFAILFIIFLLEGTANNGILSGHFVPMLLDRGYTAPQAVGLLGASGLAAMAARVIVGWCLDFVNGPVFSAIVMLLPVCGVGLLWSGAGSPAPFFAAVCIGLAIGAEVDMLGFFASRYFGRRAFGTLYGLIFAAFTAGIGIGPVILGKGFDAYHSYNPVLGGYFIALIVAALLFLPLGAYRYRKGIE